MKKKKDSQLFITALRVLSKSIHAEEIEAQDIQIVRRHALREEMDLPLDELCCRLVNRAVAQRCGVALI